MKVAIPLMASIAGVLPIKAHKHEVCRSRECNERVAADRCSQARPQWCVERAIVTYRLHGWQSAWMRRIPGCESTWNPYARNGSGSSGLYQFMPSTWAALPYRRHSIFSAKWSSLAAGYMVRANRTGEWTCA